MAANITVTTASNFLASIGINTHSGFGTGAYDNSALVIDSLNYIGVDLVRDTFAGTGENAPVVAALASAGVKFDFVTSSDLPAGGSAALTSYVAALQAFQAAHPDSIKAIEGINEANIQAFSYNGSSSMAAAGQFQAALYTAVKGDAALSDIPVINLSLGLDSTTDYKALGNLGAYSDYANVHAYTNTSNSADATMEYSISLAESASVGDPLVVTETGYTTLESAANLGVSQLAQAKLVLDNLLDAYQNGATTTYLYELFDTASASTDASEQHFGIFNEDGTPKLAATALHNLTTILSYQGAASGTTSDTFKLGNMPSNAHSLTMEKADGVYDIVLWTDSTVWNDKTDTDIVNAPKSVSVSLGSTQSVVYVYNPLVGTAPIAVYYNVSSITVPLADSPLIVEIGSASAVVDTTTTAVNPHLTMTAENLVNTIGTLEHSTGLQSITLTDGANLQVSSVATMKYMISEYADTLAKIDGTYSFTVSYGQPTWNLSQTFDEHGTLVSTTDSAIVNGVVQTSSTVWADGATAYITYKDGHVVQSDSVAASGVRTIIAYDSAGNPTQEQIQNPNGENSVTTYVNGVVTRIFLQHADGTLEFQDYHITGQTYTTQIQKVDANGAVYAVIRSHADGSLDYTSYRSADGGHIVSYYNATGHLLSQTSTRADGSLISTETDAADGSKVINTYDAAGHKVTNVVVAANGTSTTSTYTATGALTKTVVQQTNGEASTTVYTNNVKTQVVLQHADGSLEFQSYNITGQSYTTQVQKVNAAGVVYSVVRSHADGSLDYSELHNTDGSLVLTYYDATGHKTLQATTDASGNKTTLSYNTAGQLTHSLVEATGGDVTNTTYSNGIKTAVVINHADGSNEFQSYNITGQSYTTQIQKAYANGFVYSVVRSHADGSLAYTEFNNNDGTKVQTSYDATGHKLTQTTTDTAGNQTTLSYNQAGILTSEYVKHPGGSAETTAYTNGVKTTTWITNVDGSHETDSYNIAGQSYTTQVQKAYANGFVYSVVRSHADGSLAYTQLNNTDGSKVLTYYDATGHKLTQASTDAAGNQTTLSYNQAGTLTSEYVKHVDGSAETTAYTNGVKTTTWITNADGSHETDSYNITGQSYTTLIQKTDAKGNFTYIERDHADGTLDYSKILSADGSSVTTNYDAKGHVLNATTIHADKSKDVLISVQDGTGDIRHESYNSSNVLQKFDLTHQDGTTTAWALTNAQTVSGGAGNDTFYLYANDEKVLFGGGHDKVYSFDTSSPAVDHIVINTALAHAFSDLTLTQSGSDVLVTIDHDNSILLTSTQLANVHSDMFMFA